MGRRLKSFRRQTIMLVVMSSKSFNVNVSDSPQPLDNADERIDKTCVIHPEDRKDGEKKEENEEVEDRDSEDGFNNGVRDTRKEI